MSLEALPFVHHIVYNVAHQICNGYYQKILFHRYLYSCVVLLRRGGGGGEGCRLLLCCCCEEIGGKCRNIRGISGEMKEA